LQLEELEGRNLLAASLPVLDASGNVVNPSSGVAVAAVVNPFTPLPGQPEGPNVTAGAATVVTGATGGVIPVGSFPNQLAGAAGASLQASLAPNAGTVSASTQPAEALATELAALTTPQTTVLSPEALTTSRLSAPVFNGAIYPTGTLQDQTNVMLPTPFHRLTASSDNPIPGRSSQPATPIGMGPGFKGADDDLGPVSPPEDTSPSGPMTFLGSGDECMAAWQLAFNAE
jgi:hypothetical protein